jgi:hypothetical protein
MPENKVINKATWRVVTANSNTLPAGDPDTLLLVHLQGLGPCVISLNMALDHLGAADAWVPWSEVDAMLAVPKIEETNAIKGKFPCRSPETIITITAALTFTAIMWFPMFMLWIFLTGGFG